MNSVVIKVGTKSHNVQEYHINTGSIRKSINYELSDKHKYLKIS